MKATIAAALITISAVTHPTQTPTFQTYDWTPDRYIETSMAKAYALGRIAPDQARCLSSLWHEESRWLYWADNPTSSAYGIPQILGLDESLTPFQQIDKGMAYITHRYDTPCDAWTHWKKQGWY